MNLSRTILCFGEALWDELPDGPRPGGAPMNVAYHLARLGQHPVPVTAVGADERGDALVRLYRSWGLGTGTIRRHPSLPTGRARVTIGEDGATGFTLDGRAAWDEIDLTAEARTIAAGADAIVFGSLAQRSRHNRKTLEDLFGLGSPLAVFDVNLRPPYWSHAEVSALARRADVVKLNHDELAILTIGDCMEERARRLAAACGASTIAVTAGGDGAALLHGELWMAMPAVATDVVDTVGAGDAFLAALVDALLSDSFDPEEALRRALRLAAYVVASAGATPAYDPAVIIG